MLIRFKCTQSDSMGWGPSWGQSQGDVPVLYMGPLLVIGVEGEIHHFKHWKKFYSGKNS